MQLQFHLNNDLPKVTPLKAEYLRNQVKLLKNIHQPEQKSKEWHEVRNTMLTASDWGTILGQNHYQKPEKVLLDKCGPSKFITCAAMDWGNKYEDVAVSVYEHRNKTPVLEFGCLRHPSISYLGASPDGITEEGIMLEIKCVVTRDITGIPPPQYWCQVQGQLEVCELDRCDFLECKFKEYENMEEYLNDSFENNNFNLNKYGYEKGVIVKFYRESTNSTFYKYSPVNIIGEDLNIWKINIVKEYGSNDVILASYYYWYLLEASCIPIYRNQEWFNEAKVILGEFWNKVLKYRELGIEILKNDLQKEKDEKKEVKEKAKEEKKSNKKQKKMNEYILIDDIVKKSNDDSSESDESYDGYTFDNNTTLFSDDNDVIMTNNTQTTFFSDDNDITNNSNSSLFSD